MKTNWYLVAASLVLSLFFHRLYLRLRPLPTPIAAMPTPLANIPLLPSVLSIPNLSLTLPIVPAELDGNHWDTTTAGVSYLVSTPLPGSPGNSVIYGHNYPNLLGSLKQIKPGDEIVVNSQGALTRYVVTYTIIVPPSETSVYAPTTDTRLTIYTCIGLFDQNRLVVVAHPLT